MSVVKNKWMKWQQVAGIGLVCGLAIAGCSRPDDEDSADTTDITAEQQAAEQAELAALREAHGLDSLQLAEVN